jgi:glycosyltransferase involved in cell wall biosynthesis
MNDPNNFRELVSVVVPCFNHGAFLKEAVDSALRSKYAPLEIIIVDDGSTDNTANVARRIMKMHNNVSYYYQANQGPSVARNKGIKESKGVYILPLDADDKISNLYIEHAVEAIKSDEEIKIVYCNAEMFGVRTGPWKLKEFSRKRIAAHNMIFSCALFRKKDWERIGGYAQELIYCDEDWEFWISMLEHGGYAYKLESVGFYYRIQCKSRRRNMTEETKKHAFDYINRKHSSFMVSQLKGPLRKRRSLSIPINIISNVINSMKITAENSKIELLYQQFRLF